MNESIDLTGLRFGYWIVECESLPRQRRRRWICLCNCGTRRVVDAANLKRGASRSCGCYSVEATKLRSAKSRQALRSPWRTPWSAS
jgi:hypothetical protein